MLTAQQILEDPKKAIDNLRLSQQEARLTIITLIANATITLDQASRIVADCGLRYLQISDKNVMHILSRQTYTKALANIASALFLLDTRLYEQRDGMDHTCFDIAAEKGSEEWVEFYLARNLSPDLKTNYGDTLLHSICKGKPTETLIMRFKKHIHAVNQAGKTPLHFLAQNKKLSPDEIKHCVQRIIDDGAKVDVKDQEGNLPIHYALCSGNAHILDLLDPKNVGYRELAEIAQTAEGVKWCLQHYGDDPFQIAMQYSLDLAAAKLYNGEIVDEQVLVNATSKGMLEFTKALIQTGHASMRAYHGAAKHGWKEVIECMESKREKTYFEWWCSFIITRAPPWDVPDKRGKRPLDYAKGIDTVNYLRTLGCSGTPPNELEDDWNKASPRQAAGYF